CTIYNDEEFVESIYENEGFNISFYIPFNWLTWTYNEELIIIIENVTHVLRHPLKQFEKNPINSSLETVLLSTDTLFIGWNKFSVMRDFEPNEIKIEDQFSRILAKISCAPNNCEQEIKIKGLFATINCNSVISRETIIHMSLHVISLIVIMILIMLCQRKRINKSKK
ncbi:hypothetical protein Anas_00572, partial [Armadillidium nasatum]